RLDVCDVRQMVNTILRATKRETFAQGSCLAVLVTIVFSYLAAFHQKQASWQQPQRNALPSMNWQQYPPRTILTFAGTGMPDFTPDGHGASTASICYLTGLAINARGDVLFSERYHYRVRKISAGILRTLAGSGVIRWPDGETTHEGSFGGDGGPATKALLTDPI